MLTGRPGLWALAPLASFLLLSSCPERLPEPELPDSELPEPELLEPDRPLNVVILVLDTARPDHMSAYGHPEPTTPFLEELAAQGTRFDRAYSTSNWTLPAHASLFTGTLPNVHRATQIERQVASSLPLLAERLEQAGYQTAGFSGNVWISKESGLAGGFQHFRNYIKVYRKKMKSLASDRRGSTRPVGEHEIVAGVEQWAGELDPERPFFLFVNVVEPHLPYLPSREMVEPFTAGSAADEVRWKAIQGFYPKGTIIGLLQRHYLGLSPLSEDEWDLLQTMYEGELRKADEIARSLVATIDAVAAPGETLLFVASDHGENFGEDGHMSHLFNLLDSNIRIALLARGPGFDAGAVDRRPVQILDLYTTALRAAGLEPGWRVASMDLRGEIPPDRILLSSLEYPEANLSLFPGYEDSDELRPHLRRLQAAVGPRYKLIEGSDGSSRIFDLLEDPLERRPLEADAVAPEEIARLREALKGLEQEAAPTEADGEAWDDPESLQSLRDMGYAGD